MPIPNPPTFNVAHRSLHFPRDTTRHGVPPVTIIVIAVAALVGGVLIIFLCWHFLSRLSRRQSSAPLPPRQALVHQREQQLAAFTEHQNVSVPQIFLDAEPSAPVRYSSNASLIPHVDKSSTNNSYHISQGTDDGTEDISTSHGNPLHPPTPHFSAPHSRHSASSSSLPLSSNEHLADPTSLAITHSTSASPQRRPNPSSQPRPFSIASNTTAHTGMTARSRSSIRGAPHAPHSNVQIILPAPLAPDLYPPVVDEHGRRSLVGDNAYSDSWRSSLADKWIAVGQQSDLGLKSVVKRQRSHDSAERRRGRHAQKEISLGPVSQRRSNSNPPTSSHLGHFHRRSLDNSLLHTPPVPRVPAAYVTLPKQAPVVLAPSERKAPNPPLPSPPPVG